VFPIIFRKKNFHFSKREGGRGEINAGKNCKIHALGYLKALQNKKYIQNQNQNNNNNNQPLTKQNK
jgi:hypothetical protein